MLYATQLIGFAVGGRNQSVVPQATGTAIGDMTANGGLAAAFDGTTSQNSTACAALDSVTISYIGKDYSASGGKTVNGFVIVGSANQGFKNGPTLSTTNFRLLGNSVNNPATATDYGGTSATNALGLTVTLLTGLNTAEVSQNYWWVSIQNTTNNNFQFCAELTFYELA